MVAVLHEMYEDSIDSIDNRDLDFEVGEKVRMKEGLADRPTGRVVAKTGPLNKVCVVKWSFGRTTVIPGNLERMK